MSGSPLRRWGVSLTAKFLAGFVSASLIALAANAYLRVRRETEHFDTHLRRDAAAYAASLAHGVESLASRFGTGEALLLVARANASSPQLRARWVTLEDAGGDAAAPLLPAEDLEPVRRGEILSAELPASEGEGEGGSLVTYVPVHADVPGEGRTAVEVLESLEEKRRFLRGTIENTAWFSATVLALTSLVASGVGLVFIARPMRVLVDKARRMSAGDLSTPVVLRQRDELRILADELNSACDHLAEARSRIESETTARITALEQMRHADRLATVGRLASGIAHEIGTPLAVAGGRTGMIESGEVSGAEAVDSARIAGEQLRRISAIIRQLLDFARRRPAQKGPIELRALAARSCELLQPLAAKRGVRLAVRGGARASRALGDLGQLEQALTNLVVNAIQATARGGSVEVGSESGAAAPPPGHALGAGEFASLCVEDTGSGMDSETRSHIFEPFFTTKPVGEGSGLGLSVTYGIVQEHGGWMDVQSEPGKGSRFTIHLPALQ